MDDYGSRGRIAHHARKGLLQKGLPPPNPPSRPAQKFFLRNEANFRRQISERVERQRDSEIFGMYTLTAQRHDVSPGVNTTLKLASFPKRSQFAADVAALDSPHFGRHWNLQVFAMYGFTARPDDVSTECSQGGDWLRCRGKSQFPAGRSTVHASPQRTQRAQRGHREEQPDQGTD